MDDNRSFYQQIEDEYNVTLRRNARKSWEDYWAWLVYRLFSSFFFFLSIFNHNKAILWLIQPINSNSMVDLFYLGCRRLHKYIKY